MAPLGVQLKVRVLAVKVAPGGNIGAPYVRGSDAGSVAAIVNCRFDSQTALFATTASVSLTAPPLSVNRGGANMLRRPVNTSPRTAYTPPEVRSSRVPLGERRGSRNG